MKFIKIYISILLLSGFIYPCSVCYGDPDNPIVKGMNNGIFFLLVMITMILVTIGYFMYNMCNGSHFYLYIMVYLSNLYKMMTFSVSV